MDRVTHVTQSDPAVIRQQVHALMRARKDALIRHWVVATAAIGACAGVLSILRKPVTEPVRPFVTVTFVAAAALCALASFYLRYRLLDDAHLEAHLHEPIDGYRWARGMRFEGVRTDVFVALPPSAQRIVGLTLLFERPFILSLALADAVALLGVGYGALSRPIIAGTPFLVAAVVLNCLHYPRLGKLLERRRKFAKADDDAALHMLERLQHRDGTAPGEAPAAQSEPAQPPQPPPRRQPRLRRASRPQRPAKS